MQVEWLLHVTVTFSLEPLAVSKLSEIPSSFVNSSSNSVILPCQKLARFVLSHVLIESDKMTSKT